MSSITAESADAVVMQEVQNGSRRALGELYERFESRAYRTAFGVCHDRDCSLDAVQDAFVSIWSSRSTYQPARGPVVIWAMSIVRHRAMYLARCESARAGASERVAPLEQQPAPDDVPREFQSRAEAERLLELMSHLPPQQREVIHLGFFEGLSHGQIASRLAVPAGTVKGRMRLGLGKLRMELEPVR
jgi:RNA polymerase sigma-70 factor, ECF subfamily